MTHANIPQNRERIFIVAFDPEQVKNYKKFKFPNEIKLTKTIHDILENTKQEDKYYYSKTHPYYPEFVKMITKKDTVYQWRRVYVRENKSNVCPTLTANMGTGGHNVPLIKDDFGIRKLTPKRVFLLFKVILWINIFCHLLQTVNYISSRKFGHNTIDRKISNEIIKVL